MLLAVAAAWLLPSADARAAGSPDAKAHCRMLGRFPTPDDPTGTWFEQLDAERTRIACEAALAADPADLASAANLGRALIKLKQSKAGVDLLRRAADGGVAQAMRSLGLEYAKSDGGVDQDYATARAWMRRAAEAGHVPAMTTLAVYLRDGTGGPVDVTEAEQWLNRAVGAGDPLAMDVMGDLVASRGDAGLAEAIGFYRRAAALGGSDGMRSLAFAYRDGKGVKADWPTARHWFERAADAGNPDALDDLANSLVDDKPWRDPAQAAALYRRGIAAGRADSFTGLGYLTSEGLGIAKNEIEAARLYREGADRGSAWGMRNLARAYARGEGVTYDDTTASEWYLKAAEAGDGNAMYEVGRRYFYGSAMKLDVAAAQRWLEATLEQDDVALRSDAIYMLAQIALRRDAHGAARAAQMLGTLAEREGRAAVALAYPGVTLAPGVPAAERLRWQAKVNASTDPEFVLAAAKELQVGRLAEQNFALAFKLAGHAYERNPIKVRLGEVDLLLSLKLYRAAVDRFAAFLKSPDFAALPAKSREQFISDGTKQLEYAWGSLDANSVPTLRELDARDIAGGARGLMNIYSSPGPLYDVEAAKRWAKRAIALGYVGANVSLGVLVEGEDPALAQTYYRRAADSGSAVAKSNVAALMMFGWVKGGTDEQIVTLLQDATKQGWLRAKYYLALMYFAGRGTPRDDDRGMDLLLQAIECDEPRAVVALGRAYLEGVGVRRNVDVGMRWLRIAGRQGDAVGQVGLARALALGWGGQIDLAGATAHLIEARALGDGEAAGWLETCGEAPTLACLRGAAQFVPPPLAPSPSINPRAQVVVAPEAELLAQVRKAARDSASTVQQLSAMTRLERLYQLDEQPSRLLQAQARRILVGEDELRDTWGTAANYFALIGSSCHWAQASKSAQAFGRARAALFFAKVAVNKLQQARQRIADLDDDIRECFIKAHQDRYRYLADLFLSMGRFDEAETVLSMLKDFEFRSFTGTDAGNALATMALHPAEQKVMDLFVQADTIVATARLTRMSPATAANARELDELEVSQEGALQRISAAIDALDGANDPWPPSPMQVVVQRRDDPNFAAAQAVVTASRTFWIVTTRTGQTAVPITVAASDVAAMVRELRTALTDPRADATAPAAALYRKLFAPVDAALKAAGITKVALSLDGELRYVPFAALYDGRDWLLRRYTFANFGTLADLQAARTRHDPAFLGGFGAAQAALGLPALPGVPSELAGISSIFSQSHVGSVMALDGDFTAARFEDAVTRQEGVIHVASHFSLDARRRDASFLLLGDGQPFSLQRFARGGLRFGAADLLVLSACETALSRPDASGIEIDSFARTAQDAGVPRVLASLWQVADGSTAALMQLFYYQRLTAAGGDAQALRAAQLALMDGTFSVVGGEKPHFDHPYYWAPFTLLGQVD